MSAIFASQFEAQHYNGRVGEETPCGDSEEMGSAVMGQRVSLVLCLGTVLL
jgi:hypothetical protein